MKILHLFLLGGGLYFLNKKSSIKNTKQEKSYIIIGSENIGYTIDNNCKLIIYNKQKSLNYAFNLGKTFYTQNIEYALDDNIETKPIGISGIYNLEKTLIGPCFDSKNIKFLSKNDVSFLFNMIKFLYSGYAVLDPKSSDNDLLLMNLSNYLNVISLNNYDISDFKVELVK